MTDILQVLQQTPICYVTRDLERAEGLCEQTKGFFVVTNYTPYSQKKAAENSNIFCIQSPHLLNTAELLQHAEVQHFLEKNKLSHILVFKPTTRIERICTEQKLHIINPPAKLANKVEEKISQIQWLGELAVHLPPHYVAQVKDIGITQEPMIIQFNHAHTGTGTMRIDTPKQLNTLKNIFPNRPAKVTAVIQGFTITVNAVVGYDVLVSSLNYQITGLAPFTSRPFATIGNDYALANKLLNYTQQTTIKELANKIGKKLKADGWKGAFGIDVIIDKHTQQVYLLEVNARQPASVSFESKLQQQQKSKRSQALTTFEAHILALLDQDFPYPALIPVENGAQITVRKQQNQLNLHALKTQLNSFTTIPYKNTEPESDLLRIQSQGSIMEDDMIFNSSGEKILQSLNQ